MKGYSTMLFENTRDYTNQERNIAENIKLLCKVTADLCLGMYRSLQSFNIYWNWVEKKEKNGN